MDNVRVYFDRTGNTLSVWFDDPAKEHVCDEIEDDVILMKDRRACRFREYYPRANARGSPRYSSAARWIFDRGIP